MSEISIINVEKDYPIKDNEARINIKNISNKIGNWSNTKTISEEIQDIEEKIENIQPTEGYIKTINTLTPDVSGNINLTASDIDAAAEQDLINHINKLGTATEAGHVKVVNEIKIGEDAPEYETEGNAVSPAAVQTLAQSLSLEINKKMDKGDVIQKINNKNPGPDGNIIITGNDILYNTEGETSISINQKINEVEQQNKIEANPEIPEEVVEIDLTDIKIGDEYYKIKSSGGEGGTNVVANPEGEPTDDLNTIQIENTIYKVSDNSIEPNPEEESTETLEKIKIKDTVYDLKAGSNVTPNPEEEATIFLKKIKIEDTTYSIDGGVTSVQVGDGEKQTGDVIITLPEEKNEVAIGNDESIVDAGVDLFIDESMDYVDGTITQKKLPFQFKINEETGEYGYIKKVEGADTFVPFSSGALELVYEKAETNRTNLRIENTFTPSTSGTYFFILSAKSGNEQYSLSFKLNNSEAVPLYSFETIESYGEFNYKEYFLKLTPNDSIEYSFYVNAYSRSCGIVFRIYKLK